MPGLLSRPRTSGADILKLPSSSIPRFDAINSTIIFIFNTVVDVDHDVEPDAVNITDRDAGHRA
jgi:hypothetical protein